MRRTRATRAPTRTCCASAASTVCPAAVACAAVVASASAASAACMPSSARRTLASSSATLAYAASIPSSTAFSRPPSASGAASLRLRELALQQEHLSLARGAHALLPAPQLALQLRLSPQLLLGSLQLSLQRGLPRPRGLPSLLGFPQLVLQLRLPRPCELPAVLRSLQLTLQRRLPLRRAAPRALLPRRLQPTLECRLLVARYRMHTVRHRALNPSCTANPVLQLQRCLRLSEFDTLSRALRLGRPPSLALVFLHAPARVRSPSLC
eukprot:1190154-Prorocentrum_minimum.AAC.1